MLKKYLDVVLVFGPVATSEVEYLSANGTGLASFKVGFDVKLKTFDLRRLKKGFHVSVKHLTGPTKERLNRSLTQRALQRETTEVNKGSGDTFDQS